MGRYNAPATATIADGSVTTAKLATGAVTSNEIADGTILNADVNASAAVAYSKLALTGSVVNADVNASAAIAYSKLALTGAVLNADLAGSIATSKISGPAWAKVKANAQPNATNGSWTNGSGAGHDDEQALFSTVIDAATYALAAGDVLQFDYSFDFVRPASETVVTNVGHVVRLGSATMASATKLMDTGITGSAPTTSAAAANPNLVVGQVRLLVVSATVVDGRWTQLGSGTGTQTAMSLGSQKMALVGRCHAVTVSTLGSDQTLWLTLQPSTGAAATSPSTGTMTAKLVNWEITVIRAAGN